jgi:hypothetical protein
VDEAIRSGNEDNLKYAQDNLERLSQALYARPASDSVPFAKITRDYILRYDELNKEIEASQNDLIKKAMLETELDTLRTMILSRGVKADLEERLRGFGFGIALAAVIDVGGRDRIESASLDPTGRVRVEADSNVRANFMFESHYFFTPNWSFPLGWLPKDTWAQDKLGWVEKNNWGWGPFVVIQPGSNNIIESVGLGWMVGFKRTTVFKGTEALPVGDSFNIGVGALIDIKQKVLGDGIRANELLPAGETALRFKETSQVGAVVIFSYSFY